MKWIDALIQQFDLKNIPTVDVMGFKVVAGGALQSRLKFASFAAEQYWKAWQAKLEREKFDWAKYEDLMNWYYKDWEQRSLDWYRQQQTQLGYAQLGAEQQKARMSTAATRYAAAMAASAQAATQRAETERARMLNQTRLELAKTHEAMEKAKWVHEEAMHQQSIDKLADAMRASDESKSNLFESFVERWFSFGKGISGSYTEPTTPGQQQEQQTDKTEPSGHAWMRDETTGAEYEVRGDEVVRVR